MTSPARSEFHRRIQDQYEAYPFPWFDVIEAEDPEGRLTTSWNLDLGLPPEAWLPERPRVWVAGASTRAAVQLALQHRGARVIASDLSRESIALQSRIAEQLGLDNIEFRHEDLTRAGYRGEFDFVSCIGVIMILESPEAGLAALRAAAAKGGVVEIMLYGTIIRADAMRSQEILRTIDPDCGARERMALALRLFSSVREGRLGRTHPLVAMGRELAGARPEQLNNLADVVTHPYERAYDVYEVCEMMRRAELHIRSWKNPLLWQPERYLRSEKLAPKLAALGDVDRRQLAYLLGAPLHELFVEDAARPRRFVPVEEQPVEELVARPLATYLEHRFEGDQLVRTRRRPRLVRHPRGYKVSGGERRPGVSAYWQWRILPPVTARVLELADGRRTVGEIERKVAREEKLARREREALRQLLRQLLVPHSRLLAVHPRGA